MATSTRTSRSPPPDSNFRGANARVASRLSVDRSARKVGCCVSSHPLDTPARVHTPVHPSQHLRQPAFRQVILDADPDAWPLGHLIEIEAEPVAIDDEQTGARRHPRLAMWRFALGNHFIKRYIDAEDSSPHSNPRT